MPKRGVNTVDAHVGHRVRLRRMLLGMSQERLGELLGLTFQQIQKYENGTNRCSAGRLFDVARILCVPIIFFYEDIDPSVRADGFAEGKERPPVMEFLSRGEGLKLSLAFMRIRDVNVRRRIFDLVRSLGDEKAAETRRPSS